MAASKMPRQKSASRIIFNLENVNTSPHHTVHAIHVPLEVRLSSLHTTMAVLLETSAGDIVIDLKVSEAPKLCEK